VLGGETAHCSNVDCAGAERCRHLLSVLSEQNLPLIERATDEGRSEATRVYAERRAKRVAQREAGARRLLVCNDPFCRRPDSKAACTHRRTLESWECLPPAALDTGHSHKKVDTVMSRSGGSVASLCERWGKEGVRQRNKANHFCAPRPLNALSPCGRPWQVESKKGALTTAGARYEVTTYRRVCRIAPGLEAACCSVAYDGQVSVNIHNHVHSRFSFLSNRTINLLILASRTFLKPCGRLCSWSALRIMFVLR
jgi:hypothetical protein